MHRIYLAGPDVFLPYARETAAAKKELCAKHGFEGVFPLDGEVAPINDLKQMALQISNVNEKLIHSCDLLIANMTPFRGPSMDVGTAFEMGFMRALGRPVFGYTNTTEPFAERTIKMVGGHQNGSDWFDPQGMLIENFELADNLMMEGAIAASGGRLVALPISTDGLYTDLKAFEKCIELAKTTSR